MDYNSSNTKHIIVDILETTKDGHSKKKTRQKAVLEGRKFKMEIDQICMRYQLLNWKQLLRLVVPIAKSLKVQE